MMSLSHRDQAILRAVAAGRCRVSRGAVVSLQVDGMCCCDQFVGDRLTAAGLIADPGPSPEPARLTPAGWALLATRHVDESILPQSA
jgi:hypothetical protein